MSKSPTLQRERSSAFGDLRRGTLLGRPFYALRWFLLLICRLFFRLRTEGLERIPRAGGVLVVSNHLHNADPIILSIAVPRPVHFMAKEELFRIPVIAQIIRRVGAFPVARGRSDRNAIRRAMATLDQGIALGIFPEGTRSVTHRIERILGGAGMLALREDIAIVPIAIWGTEYLPLNGSKTRRVRRAANTPRGIWIRVGEPFTLGRTRPDGSRLTSAEASDEMMRRVAAMLPPQYRGIYADVGSPPTS